ncbi:MAG: RNA polymerase sigma factor [Acidimicrobiales bacterium]
MPDRKRVMDHTPSAVPPAPERMFRALFDEHFVDLWHFARRRCRTADEADDVAAEVFAVAWRRRDDRPSGDDARLWLFGVARRVLANQRRSTGRRDRLQCRVDLAASNLDHDPDPADVVADQDGHRLLTALGALTDDDRDLLLMRAWDGLAVIDMAVLLEVTPNAVSVRLSKARARLAAALDRKDPAPSRTGSGRSPHPEGEAS